MAVDLDFLNPSYKPALLAISVEDVLTVCKDIMRELNYKVLIAANHDDFATRFNNVQFQVVLIDELFAQSKPKENPSLRLLQRMAMAQRRHATIILLGHEFETLQPLQAFIHSVHAVVNWADLGSLSQIIPQIVAEQALFLSVYREAQARVGSGKS